jgi:hypothetical protein
MIHLAHPPIIVTSFTADLPTPTNKKSNFHEQLPSRCGSGRGIFLHSGDPQPQPDMGIPGTQYLILWFRPGLLGPYFTACHLFHAIRKVLVPQWASVFAVHFDAVLVGFRHS